MILRKTNTRARKVTRLIMINGMIIMSTSSFVPSFLRRRAEYMKQHQEPYDRHRFRKHKRDDHRRQDFGRRRRIASQRPYGGKTDGGNNNRGPQDCEKHDKQNNKITHLIPPGAHEPKTLYS